MNPGVLLPAPSEPPADCSATIDLAALNERVISPGKIDLLDLVEKPKDMEPAKESSSFIGRFWSQKPKVESRSQKGVWKEQGDGS